MKKIVLCMQLSNSYVLRHVLHRCLAGLWRRISACHRSRNVQASTVKLVNLVKDFPSGLNLVATGRFYFSRARGRTPSISPFILFHYSPIARPTSAISHSWIHLDGVKLAGWPRIQDLQGEVVCLGWRAPFQWPGAQIRWNTNSTG